MSSRAGRETERENPRTTRVRRLVLEAAVEILLADGASEVTVTRLAEETGVARTTVYRHWPDQASLLVDAIDTLVAPHAVTPHSGVLGADLTTALKNLRTRLSTRQVRPVVATLVGQATRNGAFVDAQRRFVGGLVEPIRDVLGAAQRRGELPGNFDVTTATLLLTGPLLHQHLLVHDTIDDELIETVIEQFTQATSSSELR